MFLSAIKLILAAATFVYYAVAEYTVSADFNSDNFLTAFDFFTDADPTQGFVTYLGAQPAVNSKIIGVAPTHKNATYLGVDSTNSFDTGRPSLRLTSKGTFNHGLFIFDIAHMPGGQCGVWPSIWAVGPDWPKGGEIDILEGVNDQTTNAMTLHTSANCSVDADGFSGNLTTPNCDIKAPGQPANSGCAISSYNPQSYGVGLNANGGAVYAMEWTSNAITIWFFPRDKIPADVAHSITPGDTDPGSPDPTKWGRPVAHFCGDTCNIDDHFKDMKLVINTAFCGDWAGNTWDASSCKAKAPTCNEYVAKNPQAFVDAYWLINDIKVYEDKSRKRRQRNRRSAEF
ncbi:hypothetical protein MMC07_004459 [Pseudocyphellaria aurata]|nr:hypothetical protein [Pseudocyphellaria aurata]